MSSPSNIDFYMGFVYQYIVIAFLVLMYGLGFFIISLIVYSIWKKKMKWNKWVFNKFNVDIHWLFPRPSIKYLKEHYKSKSELIGVEVGVFEGANGKSILDTLNMERLFLVDPYEDYEGNDDNGESYEKCLKVARKVLWHYRDKITWVRLKSEDALGGIPNRLDFVYIDGNHSYEYVKRDLKDYYKKIKKGGLLCGHDINKEGVMRAVIEFIDKKKLKLQTYSPSGKDVDWWCVKK